MSRIGNAPVILKDNATVTVTGDEIVVKGPKGELTMVKPQGLDIAISDGTVTVTRLHNDKPSRARHGAVRAHIANMAVGVTQGWTKKLEMSGVGFRAQVSGVNLVLSVGFSHQVTIEPRPGITFAAAEGKITVSGMDKHAVGQMAAEIRGVKRPEPYKGKGIKYEGEHIRKKAGKAKSVGGAPGAK